MPSPRAKVFFSFSYYDHYAMIKRQKFFFSFTYYDHYAMIKREESVSIYSLGLLGHDEEKKRFFFI